MKLILESWRNFINEGHDSAPQIITVDFDDTIRMTDGGYPNTEVIDKIKQFKADGAKIYIVTSRKDTSDNKLFIDDFLDENSVEHDGIYLTNTQDKWYTLGGVEESTEGKKAHVLLPGNVVSDMHFDDDQHEFDAIRTHIDEFPEDKQNIKLMKVDWKTGKVKEWKADLDEIIKKKDDEYCLQSKKGKNLGCYPSKTGAEKREKQVRYFKHKDK